MARHLARNGDREGKRTLPVNLLVKGRLCLLVGAGHVAHRKVKTLLTHGARVVLVAPDAVPGLRELAAAGQVTLREDSYDPSLLSELEPFLVYAATDDDETNRLIVQDAATRGILASSVSCWEEGDFISPSVLQWGRGQVSITTEGASCRQAKFMRIRLEELLGGERKLVLLGIDQQAMSLAEFEQVRPDAARHGELLGMLRHLAALEEFVLLATCNRLEVYAWTRWEKGLEQAVLSLLGLASAADRVYTKTGNDVLTHAANVVAGHYSEVVCETQITGQFKDAFRRAFDEDVAGVHLQRLHDRALRLGKRIRARQGAKTEGLPELVAETVRGRLATAGARVLVLGAGGLGREVVDRLSRISGLSLTWSSRTHERIPAEPACARLPLADALGSIRGFDQVVSVLGAADPVVRLEHVLGSESPPLFIDLGLPRNVEPQVGPRAGAEILDLSTFRHSGVDRAKLLALTDEVLLESGGIHA